MLRNPLASPFVIGTAQASGFGAVVAISLGLARGGVFGLSFYEKYVCLVFRAGNMEFVLRRRGEG